MAQKTIAIGIKISSEGQEKVISNLKDLETELGALQAKLKTLDFGSEAFKETTKNIQTLKTKIDDVDKSTEGLGAEKRFNAINASVGILVSSVQILSGLLGVVIANTETLEVVQRAEATAVSLLSAALGILQIRREIADQQLSFAKVKQAALTAATKAATIAQAAYNAVLAANPIGLVIAGVAALTGAIYLLVKATDSETDAQEELNKQLEIQTKLNAELAIEAKKTAQEEKVALTILTDNVRTRNLELQTIEELKKAYPGFNAFLDKNNQLTAQGIEFLKIQIKLEEAQAKLKFLRNKQTDLEIKAQTDLNEEFEFQNSTLGKLFNTIKGGLNPVGRYTALADDLQEATADENRELEVVNKNIAEQEKAVDGLLGQIAPLNKKLGEQAKAEEKVGKETNKTTEIVDKSLVAIERRTQAITMIIDELRKLQQADLNYTSQILQKGDEVLQEQGTFLESRTEKLKTQSQKLLDEINEYFFKTIPTEQELMKLQDGYKDLFDAVSVAVKTGELDFRKTTGWEDFVKFAENKLPEISKALVDVNEESKKSFVEYFNSLDNRVSQINTLTKGAFLEFFPQEATEETLKKLLDAEGKIANLRSNAVNLGLTENDLLVESLMILKQSFGLQDRIVALGKEQGEDLFNYYEAQKRGDKETEDKLKARIDARDKEAESINEIAKAILEGVINTDDFVKGFVEVNKQAEKNYQQILKNKGLIESTFTPENFAGIEQFFKENAQEYYTILFDLFNNQEEYFTKFGEDGIKAIFSGLQMGLSEIDSLGREELQDLYSNLKLLGDQFAEIFNLENNPFIKLLDEISKRLKALPTESEESFTKTIEGIKEVADVVLQVFNDILGRLQNLIQSQNSLLLEQLAYAEEVALAQIGNATEREREEQAKVQKEYAQKRFELEKKARIQELQFALASALVAGAGAVINALALPAPPPIPQIYAGVVAGLTAAQVVIIRDQIQFAQSKSFVGRRGGLIMGESHEGANGGVPALLEGGEFVVNKEGVRQFGDIISQINTSTGGRALTIDDSRIVQAIASQNTANKQPLKAYVLYNDIQDTTKLNQKITQLARL